MQKAERHKMILDLIEEQSVQRQDELAGLLHGRGFEVTQASVSRDLDELGVVKVNGRYAQPTETMGSSSPFGIAAIDTAGENLIVVRCSSGLASAAAVRLDAEKIPDVVGTIAGDDTIFVAVKGSTSQRVVVKRIRTLFASV